jgi:hypothetical protein
MKNSMQIMTLRGPVTVTYRQEGTEVHARALQFDLVGIGKSRKSALKELQEIFADYAEEVLNTKGKVRFFNPSDSEEWENSDKQLFSIVFVLVRKASALELPSICDSIRDLRPMRDAVKTVQLQPYCYA